MIETSRATRVDDQGIDLLFRKARTHNGWSPEPVAVELLQEVYDLARMGPTSANGCPARFVFLTTDEAKQRLRPALAEGNVQKTMAAPVVVIVAHDLEFYERFGKLSPAVDFRSYFVGKPDLIAETAFRNSSLQGAYFMLAARAFGLDCGPMSGFDAAKLDQEFFPDGKWKVNFLCNLGYGDDAKLRPRAPRLDFDEACVVL